MVAQLIDGKALASTQRKKIAAQIAADVRNGFTPPGLAVILIGNDPASEIYVHHKREACKEVGIQSIYYQFSDTVSQAELIALIHKLNADPAVTGILIQLPLPAHIDSYKIVEHIHPQKDVDGFHPHNMGKLAQRRPELRPCTPKGVMAILESIQAEYKNKHAVIVGASNIVGRPMALELLLMGCTVTVCHRFTENLPAHVQQADILISACGKAGLIKGEWIKPGAIVIDVGISRLSDGSIKGDVEFETAKMRAGWITPVPGGVGPMTIATLLQNTLLAAKYRVEEVEA